jgi:hypothetical protein
MFQPNQSLKFRFAKYAKPPSSDTSKSAYESAPQIPAAMPSSRPRPCEMNE